MVKGYKVQMQYTPLFIKNRKACKQAYRQDHAAGDESLIKSL